MTIRLKSKKDDNKQLSTAIYGPNDQGRRGVFWEEIIQIGNRADCTWVIGDFNVVRFTNERNESVYNGQKREDFNMVIDQLGLSELSITDRLYIYGSTLGRPFTCKIG